MTHPPTNLKLRAFCVADRSEEPLEYLARNRAIVLASCPLVGLPSSQTERLYGGTWGTIRFARACKRPVVTVLPDGTMLDEYGAARHLLNLKP